MEARRTRHGATACLRGFPQRSAKTVPPTNEEAFWSVDERVLLTWAPAGAVPAG